MLEIFVDYDGTITDLDTYDVLVREYAGHDVWQRMENDLHDGRRTLRETLANQARFVRCSLDDADTFLRHRVRFDPAFSAFVDTARTWGASVTVLSSGVEPLIRRALARQGLADVPVLANDVTVSDAGWTMCFRDDSENGHDKAARVRTARERGSTTAYVGDGYSDYAAALAADRRFVKRGRALETYLRERGMSFVPFSTFAQVQAALFDARLFDSVTEP